MGVSLVDSLNHPKRVITLKEEKEPYGVTTHMATWRCCERKKSTVILRPVFWAASHPSREHLNLKPRISASSKGCNTNNLNKCLLGTLSPETMVSFGVPTKRVPSKNKTPPNNSNHDSSMRKLGLKIPQSHCQTAPKTQKAWKLVDDLQIRNCSQSAPRNLHYQSG